MRKKDANPYRPVKSLEPPYLTKQEISNFYEEFTLLDNEISVKRIAETVSSQNLGKSDKMINNFFDQLKRNKLDESKKVDCKISFEEYFQKMIQFFVQNNDNNEMLLQMLADSESGQISKETIREAMEDSIGRKVDANELTKIMEELKRDNFLSDKLKSSKVEQGSQI